MFFVKKLVGVLLDPLVAGLLLLGLGLVWAAGTRWRRVGRVLVGLGLAVLVLPSLWPVANLLAGPLERRYPAATAVEGLEDVRWVAVLGGGHAAVSGQPETEWLSPGALGRLVEGVRLVRQLDDAALIVSGWAGREAQPTASVMAEAAVSLGVAPERIAELPTPRDTAEELRAIGGIVGGERFFLVTSATHLPRAVAMAERLDMRPLPAPADFNERGGRGWRRWVPTSEAMTVSAGALHEYVGRAWYALAEGPTPVPGMTK